MFTHSSPFLSLYSSLLFLSYISSSSSSFCSFNMVVASPTPIRSEKVQAIDLPIIDLSLERSEVSKLIVRACEEYGFFKVINHGVPEQTIAKMEEESLNFFAKPVTEKQLAGPASPFGYGCKNIGFNGDFGEVEYLVLHTNPLSIAQRCQSISSTQFRSVVSGYVEAVRELACKILDLVAEGLWVHDTSAFSRLIRDVESDSAFRLNHYPPVLCSSKNSNNICCSQDASCTTSKVGFGEHSDPQILTILRSNDVGGLEISLDHGVWVPVSPDPNAFCVNVGDLLQAMTNGKFVSVRHRALTNTSRSRMSMAYFGAPPLHAMVTAPPELVTPTKPSLYRPFTWADYKKAAYSLRLGDSRLQLFRNCNDHDQVA